MLFIKHQFRLSHLCNSSIFLKNATTRAQKGNPLFLALRHSIASRITTISCKFKKILERKKKRKLLRISFHTLRRLAIAKSRRTRTHFQTVAYLTSKYDRVGKPRQCPWRRRPSCPPASVGPGGWSSPEKHSAGDETGEAGYLCKSEKKENNNGWRN